jgi:hypothetical protein
MIFEILNIEDITFAIVKNKEKYEIKINAYHDYIKNKQFKDFLEETYDLTQMDYDLIPDELEEEILSIIKKEDKTSFIIKECLNNQEHEDIIGFIDRDDLKRYFLKTLEELPLYVDDEYEKDCFEFKILDMMLEDWDNISSYKEKIFIDDISISKLSKNPYITFKYGKVISPKSYENKNKDEGIVNFISSLDKKYQSFFKLEEDDKDEVYKLIKREIRQNPYSDRQINTFNRLLYIILYSLEKDKNFIKKFSGLKDNFYGRYGNSENSFQVLYNVFKKISLTIDEIAKKEIFEIEDFFPNKLTNNYYILDEKFALAKERLPTFLKSNQNILEDFKKLGLKIDTNVEKIRKFILESKEINSDDLNILTKEQYENTISFLGINQFEFKLKSIDYTNIEKLFKKMDSDIKFNLSYYPYFQNLSKLKFERNLPSYSSYCIDKNKLNSKNKFFKDRLKKEINNKYITYIDILNIDEIPKDWIIIEESEEEKIKNKQKSLDKREESMKMKTRKSSQDDFEYKWQIGWKGEKFVYKSLIQKFPIDSVVWHNENSESSKDDRGVIDIEIKNKLGNTIHKIEVKTTVNSSSYDETLTFYMSSRQFKHAQQFGNNTHLIFVTGINDLEPKMLVMNFDNDFLA